MPDSVQWPSSVTAHARARMIERGVTLQMLGLIYCKADLTFPGQRGCIQLALSRPKLETLAILGVSDTTISAVAGVIIVLHAATDMVVTVYRLSKPRGREWGRALALGKSSPAAH